jgi:hypothetical protein
MIGLLLAFYADRVFTAGRIWPQFPAVGPGLDL